MEFLRLAFVALLTWQESSGWTLKQKILKSLMRWLPYFVIPVSFLVWRVFLFHSTRPATDVGLQLGQFFASPLNVVQNMLYSIVNTVFSAWIVPFYSNIVMGNFRSQDNVLLLAVGAGVSAVVLLGLWKNEKDSHSTENRTGSNWIQQAMLGGFLAMSAGVIPVILANRSVTMGDSRYALASLPGTVMMLVAGLYLLNSQRLRMGLVGLLVFLSASTHFGNAIEHVYQADSLRDFWWQVSWRAPSIEAGTNLVVSYSLMQAPENYVIWAPANLIYFPEKQEAVPIRISLPASILSRETVTGIIGNGEGRGKDERGNNVKEDFTAVLVLTQPTSGSCVRILDGSMPELSPFDRYEVMLTAPYSLIGNINMAPTSPTPPEDIFGPEPVHGWCYYYQKAALARQFDDWSTVIALGDEAIEKGFEPFDQIEWMPFLQAYVVTGQINQLEPYASIMTSPSLIRLQTCQILKQTASEERPDDLELMTFIESNFCP
jgi:hypothetical protein